MSACYCEGCNRIEEWCICNAPRAADVQIGGDHYKRMKIEPIVYIIANNLDFCEGSVVKYVSRWKFKGGVEDLKKARQNLDFLIEREEAKTEA